MKTPKITLKKISFYERMSEETNCFVADLYIDGKKVGEAKNDGQGGSTIYYGFNREDIEIIRQVEDYFMSLPKVKSEYGFMYQPSLEFVIDEQLELYLKAKSEKKMQKLFEKAIVFGKPNSGTFNVMKFKVPLSKAPKNALQFQVDLIRKQYCVDGVIIFNTNLEELGITV